MSTPDTTAGIELELIEVIADVPDKNGNTMLYESDAEHVLEAIKAAGFAIIRDEPHHYVTFDAGGWFIEHSVACRVAGTLGTCAYNEAIRMVADDMDGPDPDLLGRHRITEIDSEGLPSLERAEGT